MSDIALRALAVRAFAPAKINLALHVTGQRADGYHMLDSLVVFAAVGDWLTVEPAAALILTVTGPFAARLAAEDNLVLRAARVLGVKAAITLDKHLPIASGIGGGSADAAAALRALSAMAGVALPDAAAVLALGADVPVCLECVPLRMQGVGEVLTPLPALPECYVVLVNPGVAVATRAVFKALPRKDNPAMAMMPVWRSAGELAAWLAEQRNDLEAPAIELAPVIAEVKAALAVRPGCLLARMSGSGATCYGLFASEELAKAAAGALREDAPAWWVAAAAVL
ncbi:MAG: 4-(cytidine 5-diphospho)-2-C-methyl-D-erythritol kinase [Cypionkella sp.]|uniref:4-(cytidine 5'-diphospho)-2-C-methyl-D-erythritol kinase n=1 Tax=Cypionkella sp. TaxID=2811411 RepID=UPI002604D548|nr:4-(cytidine 5'-diphospho)-2-C-methyl-D-erythritol kinase [Cypionkella sp.]MDB5659662.1 4-(cytidine 5-diphospho)-2-C-methyl-D-erythritol kinase [Cypionkella sp.]